MKPLHRRSPAMVVALLSLFVALGGVGIAANGGSLILGQSNSATAQTGLTGNTSDAALAVTNSGGGVPLRLQGPTSRPPLTVNSALKVAGFNADKLDGFDSGGFVQGRAKVLSNHLRELDDGVSRALLKLPGIGTLSATCTLDNGVRKSQIGFTNTSGVLLDVVVQDLYQYAPYFFDPSPGATFCGLNPTSDPRGTSWEMNKDAEASGPVTHVLTDEVPYPSVDPNHCFAEATAVVQS